MNNRKTIYVYENFRDVEPSLVGNLYVEFIKGKERFSFEYTKEYLQSNNAMQIDPELPLTIGRLYPVNKTIFGVFTDACPDRWGRLLMKRREVLEATKEERSVKELYENDFLFGVYDDSRMGALRFKLDIDGDFLNSNKDLLVPPLDSLRKLESASLEFEKDENLVNDKWLKQLIYPGSSLGGARPKANVIDENGEMWIAKFPSRDDEIDVGAWEKTAYDLAKMCNINVSESKLFKFSKLGSTFLSKRFDREGEKRVFFISAMTALGKIDSEEASYLELASFIKNNGANPKEDLKELFKRLIFNIAISNCDDHLRNHGFILTNKGFILSKAFDLNPNIYKNTLVLTIDGLDNSKALNKALDTYIYYDLSLEEAKDIVESITKTICLNWEKVAKSNLISDFQIEYMKNAFINN